MVVTVEGRIRQLRIAEYFEVVVDVRNTRARTGPPGLAGATTATIGERA
jgi:hypothetical protein